MRPLTALILTAGSPVTVQAGTSFFELAPDAPLVLPFDRGSKLFLTVWGRCSEADGSIPVPRLVEIGDGGGNVPIVDWGDALEVRLDPLKLRGFAYERPRLLDSAQLRTTDGRRIRAELFYDCGLSLMLSDRQTERLPIALGDGEDGRLSVLDVGSARLVTVSAKTERGERLVILTEEGEILLDETGADAGLEDGYPTVIEALGTVRGHERRTRYAFSDGAFRKLGSEIGFFKAEEHIPSCAEEIALSAVQEVGLGAGGAWTELLSDELKEKLTEEAFTDFLGGFEEARLHPVEERDGFATVGLIRKREPVMKPDRFLFIVENGRISDVREQ